MLKKIGKITFMGLAVLMMLNAAAIAMEQKHGSQEVRDRLDMLKTEAAKASRQAAELESFTRSMPTWRTHADQLNYVKIHINRMADLVADLEDIKPEANEVQAKAVEVTRPKLANAAAELTRAINMLNEDRNALLKHEYKSALRGVLENASDFHTSLNTLLDYNDAKLRAEQVM